MANYDNSSRNLTPADDQSVSLGQRADGPGGGLSKGRNTDKNVYGYKGSTRVHEGSKTPSGAEGVKGFAAQDGSIPSNEFGIDSKWNYLSDENLRPKELLSGDFKQPKFTDFAGGISAPQPRKDMLRYQSDPGFKPDVPSKREIQKGFRSRENDWRGDE